MYIQYIIIIIIICYLALANEKTVSTVLLLLNKTIKIIFSHLNKAKYLIQKYNQNK